MLNYEYPPLGGGASPITAALSGYLVAAAHEVDVVTMGFRGLPPYEEHGGLRIFRVPAWRRSQVVCSTPEMFTYLPAACWRALQLDRQAPYDLIHAHFIIPTSPVGVALRALRHRPLVVSLHGSDVPGYNPDRFTLGHRVLGPAWRWLTRQADAIVSPSAYLADLLRSQSDVPVTVIPHGFDPPPVSHVDRQRRLLLVSRLFPRKGVQYFLEAVAGLPRNGWEIIVAGDGPSRAELESQAARLGVEVRFAGFVQGQELQDLYAGGTIFVFPSLRESFGVVLLEAMNAGCAVIASAISGIPEVVGDAGVLVPPANVPALREALSTLMSNEAAVAGYQAKAQERATLFRWPAIIRQYETLYDQVLRRSRNRGEPR